LLLPVVVVLVLAVVQVGVVARANVLVGVAAREAARAAAIGQSDTEAHDAAARASGLDPTRLRVDVDVGDSTVTAHAAYRDDTTIPLVGRLAAPVTVRADVTMHREH
jgi:Flp pilus assembly protein TadG